LCTIPECNILKTATKTTIDKVTAMRTRFPKSVILLSVIGAMLLISAGMLVGKARIAPHQFTVFFTGDDEGRYKYCA